MDHDFYQNLALAAADTVRIAMQSAEYLLPPKWQAKLAASKRHALNPWDTMKWEYEISDEWYEGVADVMTDLVNLSIALANLKTVGTPKREHLPVESLNLQLAKTRRSE